MIKASVCNQDSGLRNGLQGPLRGTGRLLKDLCKDWTSSTTAIIANIIRISKSWAFVWFVGWVLGGLFSFACTSFSAVILANFDTTERLQEAWSSCISNFKTGRQQKTSRLEHVKAKLKAKTRISTCVLERSVRLEVLDHYSCLSEGPSKHSLYSATWKKGFQC